MKKGLRHDTVFTLCHFEDVLNHALMKKGLRPINSLWLMKTLQRSKPCPDEEGIETAAYRPTYVLYVGSKPCPDEEGIETSLANQRLYQLVVLNHALMKKGLRLCVHYIWQTIYNCSKPCPDEEGIETGTIAHSAGSSSSVLNHALMKKGLRRFISMAISSSLKVLNHALMKKGLRQTLTPASMAAIMGSKPCPDEEGIETYQRRLNLSRLNPF